MFLKTAVSVSKVNMAASAASRWWISLLHNKTKWSKANYQITTSVRSKAWPRPSHETRLCLPSRKGRMTPTSRLEIASILYLRAKSSKMKKLKKFTKAILNWSNRASNRLNGKRTTQSYSNGAYYHLPSKRKKMLRISKMKNGTQSQISFPAEPPSSVKNGGVLFKNCQAWKVPGPMKRPQFSTESPQNSKSTTVLTNLKSGSKFLLNSIPKLALTERPGCAAKNG